MKSSAISALFGTMSVLHLVAFIIVTCNLAFTMVVHGNTTAHSPYWRL